MYGQKFSSNAIVRASNAHDTAENLVASTATHGSFYVMRPIKVNRFYFAVTTVLLTGTTAPVVQLRRRTLLGSSGTSENLCTLTIPNGTAVGKVIYKEFEPVLVYPGDELVLEHVTQGADGGTATGAGFYGFDGENVGEALSNCGDWVASA